MVYTRKSNFSASSTEFFTTRLFFNASETASSTVSSGISGACCASDRIQDEQIAIVITNKRCFDFMIVLPVTWLRLDADQLDHIVAREPRVQLVSHPVGGRKLLCGMREGRQLCQRSHLT